MYVLTRFLVTNAYSSSWMLHPLVGPGRAGHNSEITLSSSKQHKVSLETWRLLRVTEEKVWFAKETKDNCWKKREIKIGRSDQNQTMPNLTKPIPIS